LVVYIENGYVEEVGHPCRTKGMLMVNVMQDVHLGNM